MARCGLGMMSFLPWSSAVGWAVYRTGSIVRRDGKYVITALVIECDPEVCQTHRLNNPSVPVLQQRIVNANETKHIVARFLPRSHWRRAWFHSSD